MRLFPFITGAVLFCLVSCTNLSSFENAYLRVQAGKGEPIEAYNKGQECYSSFSPFVTVPKYPMRFLGGNSYDEYLICYTAVTCAIDQSAYTKLKTQHIRTEEQRTALEQELELLQSSPSVSPEGKLRIQSELARLGRVKGAETGAMTPSKTSEALPTQADSKEKPKNKAQSRRSKKTATTLPSSRAPKVRPKKSSKKMKVQLPSDTPKKSIKTKPAKQTNYWDSQPDWQKAW